MERKSRVPLFYFLLFLVFSSGDAPPGRHGLGCSRVAAGKQHLEFVGLQNLRRLTRTLRPETKPACRQALVTQFRMQMLRSQQRALCASRIRSIRSAGGNYLAWASGTTAME